MRYFKGKQFKKDIILVAIGYYCRFSLSYRDVSEILQERGVSVHPTTIMRWVHEYGNLIAHHAWYLDETYIKVKGAWCYLYRAINGDGYTLDLQLRRTRDHQAALCQIFWIPKYSSCFTYHKRHRNYSCPI